MDENSDFDFVPGINVRQEILPYQHEPEPDVISGQDSEFDSDSDDIESGDEREQEPPGRVGNTDWCQCGHCVPMDSEEESVCCQELHRYSYRLEEADVQCITDHPGFHVNCCNPHVLELSFWEFLQNNGPIGDEEPRHETFRYIAYRRFARFIYQRLPKHYRRIHAACAVGQIRQAFQSQEYTGFKYP